MRFSRLAALTHSLTALTDLPNDDLSNQAPLYAMSIHLPLGERIHPPFRSIPFGCWWSSLSDRIAGCLSRNSQFGYNPIQ